MTERHVFQIGGVKFHPNTGELHAQDAMQRLQPRASSVLGMLCRNEGRIVSRQALLDACWSQGEGSDEALTQAVAQIRRSLQRLGADTDLIQTHAKRGYRVKEIAPEAVLGSAAPAATRRFLIRGRRARFAVTAAAAALLIAWSMHPHAPLHFIRHGLGLFQSTVTAHN